MVECLTSELVGLAGCQEIHLLSPPLVAICKSLFPLSFGSWGLMSFQHEFCGFRASWIALHAVEIDDYW